MAYGSSDDAGPIFLDTPSNVGYILGRVVDDAGQQLEGIEVSAVGFPSTFTDSQGQYFLRATPGAANVKANPAGNGQNVRFGEDAQTVTVTLGRPSPLDFRLSSVGQIRGRVVVAGTSRPLPGVTVTASLNGVVRATAASDPNGDFVLAGLSAGASYDIEPRLDALERCVSPALPFSASVGNATPDFQVASAMQAIPGRVLAGTPPAPITSGVLIYATQTPLPGFSARMPPPVMDSASLAGGLYGAVSDAEGNYRVSVPGDPNTPYRVYAWYTTWSNGVPVMRAQQIRRVRVDPAAGSVASQDFHW